MNLLTFLNNPEWDSPFFKILAHNDTGEAAGHQGGMYIPKDLRKFFPRLIGEATPESPTTDTDIEAYLYNQDNIISFATIRYQNQTWGGERRPETRLTGSLGPIRNIAAAGDMIIFQRNNNSLLVYRLILIKKDTREYQYLDRIIGLSRWGILFTEPMQESDLDSVEQEQTERHRKPFALFDSTPDYTISHSKIIARSYAFRSKVIEIYETTCSVCGVRLESPSGLLELDAAHIVPRSKSGIDDVRNGIALCKRHHWAFDKGLFGITENRRIVVPDPVRAIEANNSLVALNNTPIKESISAELRAAEAALAWHRTNILLKENS